VHLCVQGPVESLVFPHADYLEEECLPNLAVGTARRLEALACWLSRTAERRGFELLQATIAATGATELIRSRATGRSFQGPVQETPGPEDSEAVPRGSGEAWGL
jgi:hypothetical protein